MLKIVAVNAANTYQILAFKSNPDTLFLNPFLYTDKWFNRKRQYETANKRS